MSIQYKAVKNPNRPGRPPAGCVWAKENGKNLVNDAGEFAYRPATAEEIAAKKSAKSVKKSGKRGRPAKTKPSPELDEEKLHDLLTKKRTYNLLTYEELEAVHAHIGNLIGRKKEAEKAKIAATIESLQAQLEKM